MGVDMLSHTVVLLLVVVVSLRWVHAIGEIENASVSNGRFKYLPKLASISNLTFLSTHARVHIQSAAKRP